MIKECYNYDDVIKSGEKYEEFDHAYCEYTYRHYQYLDGKWQFIGENTSKRVEELEKEVRRSKKVDVPTEQWQKSVERRLEKVEMIAAQALYDQNPDKMADIVDYIDGYHKKEEEGEK